MKLSYLMRDCRQVMFPSALKLLDVTIDSSARHVEVYIVSCSPTGERQPRYVDTVRGIKLDDNLFHVAYAFSNMEEMQVGSGVSFKFVSLQPPQLKDVLTLGELKVRVHPSVVTPSVQSPSAPQTATPSVPDLSPSRPSAPPIDMDTMKMILSMQQAMQKQMEDKIYKAVDARFTQLAARLQSTESKIQSLAVSIPKAEVKQDKETFAGILKRLAALEKDVRGLKAFNDSGELSAALQELHVVSTEKGHDHDEVPTEGEAFRDDPALATATSSTAIVSLS
ncbi:hypothetical protein DYB32_004712 [Aphanomyces invadans]|uniref:Uncharacterized protein n=1 Tax=Aphanomyces invadans TaxID=157072 RepID=A0A418AWQ3_9STRA|nr:hypothetical protein DYB32_004712 [Aphanomyces invadans]